MSSRKFETVSGGSNGVRWQPHMTEKNFMKMGADPVKEGYLVSSRELPGSGADPKPFTVFSIQEVNEDGTFGQLLDVIGDKVLSDKFGQIAFGSFIRAEYKGRAHKKAIKESPGYHAGAPFTQTNSYHIWEVGVDPGAIPYAEAVKAVKTANPAATVAAVKSNEKAEDPFVDNDDLPF